MSNEGTGSKGVLQGLNLNKKIKINTQKDNGQLEDRNFRDFEANELVKRSYSLRPVTIKKLQELKVFSYLDPQTTYNEIVDEAICRLYEEKKAKKED